MIEILAPCGGEEQLTAALNSGADAVYLGVTDFSARKNASNFTAEQLREAVRLCHISGVNVYVTLNTLVFDDELDRLERTVRDVADAGTDAVIVQDLGAARIISRIAPELRLHASTQMTITSAYGAQFAKECGFTRVVLAREMSRDEIERVIKNVDIETEVFVHGALCVCVSGQCLMSAMYGGRSGNRGLCAQPCRLEAETNGRHNILSLKDLSIVGSLPELMSLGVTSAKIEGRMKRPEYVAAAVTACRNARDGKGTDTDALRNVFSRSGFTQGYYEGNMKGMSGVRTADDVAATSSALPSLRKLYDKAYKRYIINIALTVRSSALVTADVICEDDEIFYTSDIIPEKAVNRAVTADEIGSRLRKTGGTIYEVGNVSITLDDGLSLSAAAVNAIRRGILDELDENRLRKRAENRRQTAL